MDGNGEAPAAISPFECPICFEEFSDQQLPTTLPCGHSCCISHMSSLTMCFACRGPIPSLRNIHPTYALRDGAMLYFGLIRGGLFDGKMSAHEIDSIPVRATTNDNAAPSAARALAAPPVSIEHPLMEWVEVRTVPPAPTQHVPHVDYEAERRRQIEADEEFARRLQLQINGAERPVPPARPARAPRQAVNPSPSVVPGHLKFHCPNTGCDTSCKTQTKLDRHISMCNKPPPTRRELNEREGVAAPPPERARAAAAPAPIPSPIPSHQQAGSSSGSFRSVIDSIFGTSSRAPTASSAHLPPSAHAQLIRNTSNSRRGVLKVCGHSCTPSSVQHCCRCADRRPVQREGTYPVYVDGMGWRNEGNRSAGYCPFCK
jgi:hypothetical protein